MAIVILHETVRTSKERKAELLNLIANYQANKRLCAAEVADANSLVAAQKQEIRTFYKNLYNDNKADYEANKIYDYTEIPDFEEELDKIVAQNQEELERLSAWEVELDAQITSADVELKEIEAFLQSYNSMLTTNISNDFNYGGNS